MLAVAVQPPVPSRAVFFDNGRLDKATLDGAHCDPLLLLPKSNTADDVYVR